jgi:RNA recognition motif-containing protein
MKIYVENLHGTIDNEKLTEIFSSFGEVRSAQIVKDVFTDVSRGFGYVEMENEAAQKAIDGLDQTSLDNLKLTVKEAPAINEQKGSYKVGSGAVNAYRFRKNG